MKQKHYVYAESGVIILYYNYLIWLAFTIMKFKIYFAGFFSRSILNCLGLYIYWTEWSSMQVYSRANSTFLSNTAGWIALDFRKSNVHFKLFSCSSCHHYLLRNDCIQYHLYGMIYFVLKRSRRREQPHRFTFVLGIINAPIKGNCLLPRQHALLFLSQNLFLIGRDIYKTGDVNETRI